MLGPIESKTLQRRSEDKLVPMPKAKFFYLPIIKSSSSKKEEQKEEDNNDKYKTGSSPKQIKIDHDKYHLLAAKNLSTRW